MKIGTLFSGIGAPEQACRRVYGEKLEHSFACEWDKYARQSFVANYDIKEEVFFKDVNDMDGTKFANEVDLVIGGSPCQAFSIAGLRKGTEDTRGQLIYQFIRIIDEVKPPHFIYENVKGMLSIEQGETIKEFLTYLSLTGYAVTMDVVNSKWYNVPQNRERVFIVGQKLEEGMVRKKVRPTDTQINNKRCVEILNHLMDKIPDFHYLYEYVYPKPIGLQKKLKDVLEPNVDEKYYLSRNITSLLNNKSIDAIKTEEHGLDDSGTRIVGYVEGINYEMAARIYDKNAVGPTIRTFQGGNLEPKILEEPVIYDDYNGNIKKDGIACILTTNCGSSAERNGQKVLEPMICAMRGRNPDNPKSRESGLPTEQMIEFNLNGTSNALTTVQKDNLVVEPNKEQEPVILNNQAKNIVTRNPEVSHCLMARDYKGFGNQEMTGVLCAIEPKILDLTNTFGEESPREYTEYSPALRSERNGLAVEEGKIIQLNDPKFSQQRIYSPDGIAPTIAAGNLGGGKEPCKHLTQDYRIRKLTPLECLRLQDFPDELYYNCKNAKLSDTQLYKQAGNSMTVKVVELLLEQLEVMKQGIVPEVQEEIQYSTDEWE